MHSQLSSIPFGDEVRAIVVSFTTGINPVGITDEKLTPRQKQEKLERLKTRIEYCFGIGDQNGVSAAMTEYRKLGGQL